MISSMQLLISVSSDLGLVALLLPNMALTQSAAVAYMDVYVSNCSHVEINRVLVKQFDVGVVLVFAAFFQGGSDCYGSAF